MNDTLYATFSLRTTRTFLFYTDDCSAKYFINTQRIVKLKKNIDAGVYQRRKVKLDSLIRN